MACGAGRCGRIGKLPARKLAMKVIVEASRDRRIGLAFQAVRICNEESLMSRLNRRAGEPAHCIARTQRQRRRAPEHTWAGMAVDAARVRGLRLGVCQQRVSRR